VQTAAHPDPTAGDRLFTLCWLAVAIGIPAISLHRKCDQGVNGTAEPRTLTEIEIDVDPNGDVVSWDSGATD
jgi:hypothetical protein